MSQVKPKILLLSAYDALSHRYWREQLCVQLGEYDWVCLNLPARYFNWRIRGNALSWSTQQSAILNQQYDAIIATSMVDLATLRGLVPHLAAIPAVVYFHENQFDYPTSSQQVKTVEPQLVSIYSSLCATKILFNSPYNLEGFLRGVKSFIHKLPDHVNATFIDSIEKKSAVLPVPIVVLPRQSKKNKVRNTLSIVWNHRWEYDKAPDRLLALVQNLSSHLKQGSLIFHIVGQQFRHQPKEFVQIKSLLESRSWLGSWGYMAKQEDYYALLGNADIVLSTAMHDFQGLSIMEAVNRGCSPLLPNRVAYPDFFAKDYLYESFGDKHQEAEQLMQKIMDLMERDTLSLPSLAGLSWDYLLPHYRETIQSLLEGHDGC